MSLKWGLFTSIIWNYSPFYTQTVSTFSGIKTVPGFINGSSNAAKYNNPSGICYDAIGNIYIADKANHMIRKIDQQGVVSTLAGGGTSSASGYMNATGIAARFNNPVAVCMDNSGNILVVDQGNHCIRKITTAGVVTLVAGGTSPANSGYVNHSNGSVVRFNSPSGICSDKLGNYYITDAGNHCIRKINSTGSVSTFTGIDTIGCVDGIGTIARFHSPIGICFNADGRLYVTDNQNHNIRKITLSGLVTTFAGNCSGNSGTVNGSLSNARFYNPTGIQSDIFANLFICDNGNHTIRQISNSGVVSTFAGLATVNGSTDANGEDARFYSPNGICVNNILGEILITDFSNHCMRKIDMDEPMIILNTGDVSNAVPRYLSKGFTYYSPDSAPTNYILAVNKTQADVVNDNAFVEDLPAFFSSFSSNGVNQEHASFLMKRSWNMMGTIDKGDVTVRFFYDPIDSANIVSECMSEFDNLKKNNSSTLSQITQFQWFKSVGLPYDIDWRNSIIGNQFPNTHIKLVPSGYGMINGVNYVDFSNITSFSGGTAGIGFGPPGAGGGVGLPVTWAGFEVTVMESTNKLSWSTASEQNADYFQVEYSHNGSTFTTVSDKIKAVGNSNILNTYSSNHSDFSAFVYYRIKQVDMDGRVDYSVTKLVKRTSQPTFNVSVYPIPLEANKVLNLKVTSIDKSNLIIKLTDITGKVMVSKTIAPNADNFADKIDMSSMASGIYFIEVKNGQGKQVIKVVK